MKRVVRIAVITGMLAVVTAGCNNGDTSSPDGYFKGCRAQVRRIQSALDAAVRTRGTLEGLNTVYDVYTYMSGGSKEKYNQLEMGQKTFCTDIWVETEPGRNYYRVEGYAMSAPKCAIVAEPGEVIKPEEMYECVQTQ